MKPEIIAVIDGKGGEAGTGSWTASVLVDGELAYSAAGASTLHTTAAEMREAAYSIGLRWIADRFPDMAVGLTLDGEEVEQALASEHLSRLSSLREAFANDTEVWPVLMKQQDVILMKPAIDESGKSDKTLRAWCREFGIGRQSGPNAPIEISRPALAMVIHGDLPALELLRAGERHAPRVERYFRHLGVDP